MTGRSGMTVEDHLIETVKQLLLRQDMFPEREVDSNSGLDRKLTNWDKGHRAGLIHAYLDAILAVRAGSARYADTRAGLRVDLLLEAREEHSPGGPS